MRFEDRVQGEHLVVRVQDGEHLREGYGGGNGRDSFDCCGGVEDWVGLATAFSFKVDGLTRHDQCRERLEFEWRMIARK